MDHHEDSELPRDGYLITVVWGDDTARPSPTDGSRTLRMGQCAQTCPDYLGYYRVSRLG